MRNWTKNLDFKEKSASRGQAVAFHFILFKKGVTTGTEQKGRKISEGKRGVSETVKETPSEEGGPTRIRRGSRERFERFEEMRSPQGNRKKEFFPRKKLDD